MPDQRSKELVSGYPPPRSNRPSRNLMDSPGSRDRQPDDNTLVGLTQTQYTPDGLAQTNYTQGSTHNSTQQNPRIQGANADEITSEQSQGLSDVSEAPTTSLQHEGNPSMDPATWTTYRDHLMSVPVSEDFTDSPARKAVKLFMPDPASSSEHDDQIILLAAKLFIVQYCRAPHANDILLILETAEYILRKVVDMFVSLCHTYGGVRNLPYFQSVLNHSEAVTNVDSEFVFESRSAEERTQSMAPSEPIPTCPNSLEHSSSSPHYSDGSSIPMLNGAVSQSHDIPSRPNAAHLGTSVPYSQSSTHESSSNSPRPSTSHYSNTTETTPSTSQQRSIPTPLDSGFQDNPPPRPSGSGDSSQRSSAPQNSVPRNGFRTDHSSRSQARAMPRPNRSLLLLRALEREEMYLKRQLTCALCSVAKAEVTFLPCGHFVACSECAQPCRVCPTCHREVAAEVKTFVA